MRESEPTADELIAAEENLRNAHDRINRLMNTGLEFEFSAAEIRDYALHRRRLRVNASLDEEEDVG